MDPFSPIFHPPVAVTGLLPSSSSSSSSSPPSQIVPPEPYKAPGLRESKQDTFLYFLEFIGVIGPDLLLDPSKQGIKWSKLNSTQLEKAKFFFCKKIYLGWDLQGLSFKPEIRQILALFREAFTRQGIRYPFCAQVLEQMLVGSSVQEYVLDFEYVKSNLNKLGIPVDESLEILIKDLVKEARKDPEDTDIRFSCRYQKGKTRFYEYSGALEERAQFIGDNFNNCTKGPVLTSSEDKVCLMHSLKGNDGEQLELTAFFKVNRQHIALLDALCLKLPIDESQDPQFWNVTKSGGFITPLIHHLGKVAYILRPSELDDCFLSKALTQMLLGYRFIIQVEGGKTEEEVFYGLFKEDFLGDLLKLSFKKHCQGDRNLAYLTAILAAQYLSQVHRGEKDYPVTGTLSYYLSLINNINKLKGCEKELAPEIQLFLEAVKGAKAEELFSLMELACILGLGDENSRVVWNKRHLGVPALHCPLSEELEGPRGRTFLFPLTLHKNCERIQGHLQSLAQRCQKNPQFNQTLHKLLHHFAPDTFAQEQALSSKDLFWKLYKYCQGQSSLSPELKQVASESLKALCREQDKEAWLLLFQSDSQEFAVQLRLNRAVLSDKLLLKLLKLCAQSEGSLSLFLGTWEEFPIELVKEFTSWFCKKSPGRAKQWLSVEGGSWVKGDIETRLTLIQWLHKHKVTASNFQDWLHPIFQDRKEGACCISSYRGLFKGLRLLENLDQGSALHRAYVEAQVERYDTEGRAYSTALRQALLYYYPNEKSFFLYRQFDFFAQRFSRNQGADDLIQMLEIGRELNDPVLYQQIMEGAYLIKNVKLGLSALSTFYSSVPSEKNVDSAQAVIKELSLSLGHQLYTLGKLEIIDLLPVLSQLSPEQRLSIISACPLAKVEQYSSFLKALIPFHSLREVWALYPEPLSDEQWTFWRKLRPNLESEQLRALKQLSVRDKWRRRQWGQLDKNFLRHPLQSLNQLDEEGIQLWTTEIYQVIGSIDGATSSQVVSKLLCLFFEFSVKYQLVGSKEWENALCSWKAKVLFSHQEQIKGYITPYFSQEKNKKFFVDFCMSKKLFSVLQGLHEHEPLSLDYQIKLSQRLNELSGKESQILLKSFVSTLFESSETIKSVLTALPPEKHKSLYFKWKSLLSEDQQRLLEVTLARHSRGESLNNQTKKQLIEWGKKSAENRAELEKLITDFLKLGLTSRSVDELLNFVLALLTEFQARKPEYWSCLRHGAVYSESIEFKKKVLEASYEEASYTGLKVPDEEWIQERSHWYDLLRVAVKTELYDEIVEDCILNFSPLCKLMGEKRGSVDGWKLESLMIEEWADSRSKNPTVTCFKRLSDFVNKNIPESFGRRPSFIRKVAFFTLFFDGDQFLETALSDLAKALKESEHEIKDLKIITKCLERTEVIESPEKQALVLDTLSKVNCLAHEEEAADAYFLLMGSLVEVYQFDRARKPQNDHEPNPVSADDNCKYQVDSTNKIEVKLIEAFTGSLKKYVKVLNKLKPAQREQKIFQHQAKLNAYIKETFVISSDKIARDWIDIWNHLNRMKSLKIFCKATQSCLLTDVGFGSSMMGFDESARAVMKCLIKSFNSESKVNYRSLAPENQAAFFRNFLICHAYAYFNERESEEALSLMEALPRCFGETFENPDFLQKSLNIYKSAFELLSRFFPLAKDRVGIMTKIHSVLIYDYFSLTCFLEEKELKTRYLKDLTYLFRKLVEWFVEHNQEEKWIPFLQENLLDLIKNELYAESEACYLSVLLHIPIADNQLINLEDFEQLITHLHTAESHLYASIAEPIFSHFAGIWIPISDLSETTPDHFLRIHQKLAKIMKLLIFLPHCKQAQEFKERFKVYRSLANTFACMVNSKSNEKLVGDLSKDRKYLIDLGYGLLCGLIKEGGLLEEKNNLPLDDDARSLVVDTIHALLWLLETLVKAQKEEGMAVDDCVENFIDSTKKYMVQQGLNPSSKLLDQAKESLIPNAAKKLDK